LILVSPTERQLHTILSGSGEKWKISSLPEQHGCDILTLTKSGVIGFQRKTFPDLVASLQDGRLYYELNQLQCSALLHSGFLVVEGNANRTSDDTFYSEANISVSTFRSIVAKFSNYGIATLHSFSPDDTIRACFQVSSYVSSGRAGTIHRPKQVTNEWGRTDSKTYAVFLLQSFPGIGPKVAAAIYDHFGGVPLEWTVTPAELALVPGIGRRRAESLMASLAPLRRSEPAPSP
jgi:ERCC4-type nuclease